MITHILGREPQLHFIADVCQYMLTIYFVAVRRANQQRTMLSAMLFKIADQYQGSKWF